MKERRRSISEPLSVDPIDPSQNDMTTIPVVQAQNMSSASSIKKRHLNRALWIQTWVLLSLAVAHKQISKCVGEPNVVASSVSVLRDQVDSDFVLEDFDSTWKGDNEDDGVIIVATVDGTLAGLSRRTGKVLWKQQDDKDISAPLLSTTTTTTSSGQDGKTVAVPSVDGRVFLTVTAKTEQTATTTVRELVHRAPFVDSRGRFYVGSRHATAAAIDRDSGEVLKVVSVGSKDRGDDTNMGDRNVVWVGRVDYSASLYDAQTGAMDVQFSSSEIMSVDDMLMSDKDDNSELTASLKGLQQHAPRLMLPNRDNASTNDSFLLATPNGNVAYRNPVSGHTEWISDVTFDSPVAFALESSTGRSLRVNIVPGAAVSSYSMEYLSKELERQMEALHGTETKDQMIVGALKTGQLFAMPLGKFSKSLSSSAGIGLPQSQSSSSSVFAIGSVKPRVPNIGRHLQDPTLKHKQKYPLSLSNTNRKCAPFSTGFPACLVGVHHDGEFSGGSFLENVQDYGALVLQQKLGLDHEEVLQQMKHQYRKKKRSFFRILASWLPPTMALIFVLSFEMGRRQRLRAKDDDATLIVSAIQPLEEENGMRKVGVIAVTDEVLGFGGHGTVVYKGMLDGRRVAVKRMLKAYHASADREISLLIESDGHPNVVRYFLKEVRGDFVYLALELCDMSLHDLIGTLQNRSSLDRGVSDVTKNTLFQITQGVRHLHSLRIVHRDLKPANILLAKSRTSKKNSKRNHEGEFLFDAFNEGLLVAKISDMGLGKQLTGQSSFGMSALGGASLSGPSNCVGESSRMVGAGPGSVGWQAPEVMSLRGRTDAGSVTSDNSSKAKQESMIDSSPLGLAMHLRTSRSIDIFSLGCIFHCTLIPGVHPFGEWYEREANIMRNRPLTAQLKDISPEAFDLVSSMIHRDPSFRPSAKQICEHPFFWSLQRRMSFLCDLSDRIECDDQLSQEEGVTLSTVVGGKILAIERNAAAVVSTSWDKKLDSDLINNVSRFRTYDQSSVRDCLRLIRNKHHHYDELPLDVKKRVGSNLDGLMSYFDSKFPRLVMHCYSVCQEFMAEEDPFVVNYSIPLCRRRITKQGEIQTSSQDEVKPTLSCVTGTNNVTQDEVTMNSISDMIESKSSMVEEPGEPRDDDLSDNDMNGMIGCDEKGDLLREHVLCDTLVASIQLGRTSNIPSIENIGIVLWEGSAAAKTLNCRGWMRSDDEWIFRTDSCLRKRDVNIKRCSEDPKFRSRLCNHWDVSHGTFCPMKKKSKCVFAHGPVELRVKEGKRNRWGKLVDKEGNNSNPNASGGEDTYGAARSVESMRKEEGKWNTDRTTVIKQHSRRNQTHVQRHVTSAEG